MLPSTLIQRQIAGLPETQVKKVTEWQAALNQVRSANFLIAGEKFQVWLRERPDGSVDLEVKTGWVPPG
ncbi:hypothetical protein BOO71_0014020 [Deinococcus marmoris]|uniref:Uncharacterized protein n=2 Tax=Deinococcus marmoris TaxID=249408 RepID=A0A1U7NS20_9DEIO|nr:hypothetical protein BOO71_0014020 [Deinococcus marmoris]